MQNFCIEWVKDLFRNGQLTQYYFFKNVKAEGMVHFDIYHLYFWGLSQKFKIVQAAENPTFSI